MRRTNRTQIQTILWRQKRYSSRKQAMDLQETFQDRIQIPFKSIKLYKARIQLNRSARLRQICIYSTREVQT